MFSPALDKIRVSSYFGVLMLLSILFLSCVAKRKGPKIIEKYVLFLYRCYFRLEFSVKLEKYLLFKSETVIFRSKGFRLFLIFNLSYVFAAILTFINSSMKDEKQRDKFLTPRSISRTQAEHRFITSKKLTMAKVKGDSYFIT